VIIYLHTIHMVRERMDILAVIRPMIELLWAVLIYVTHSMANFLAEVIFVLPKEFVLIQ